MKRAAVPIAGVLALLVAFSGTAVSAEPQPHIGLQNAWFTDADLSPYGVENGVIVISGHWFLQEGTLGMDRQAFLKARQPKASRFSRRRGRHG